VKAFTYLTPRGTAEAAGLLDTHGPGARVIAGGQTLLLAMKERAERPSVLVSLAGIPELSGVRATDARELVVGATTTYAELTRAGFSGWHKEISAIAGNLADRPVRTMGTIGGALCAADPRFDMPTLITGVGAKLELAAPSGVRTLTPEEFFRPDGGTTIASNEILAAIRFPATEKFTSVVFEKFRQRTFDAALASVLCAVRVEDGTVTEVRITAGATTPVPVSAERSARRLTGSSPAEVDVDAVANSVVAEVLGGRGGSALVQYQSELVKALTRKALLSALTTARS
jgi:carbon-monoxide dehydrogenase medium subunit